MQDICIDLVRQEDGSQKYEYKLNQRWVKNNRDPENVAYVFLASQPWPNLWQMLTQTRSYGTPLEEHRTFRYADLMLLFNMALADGALFGYKSWDQIWDQTVPDGDTHVKILWEEAWLNKPIIRDVTFDGVVTEEKLKRSTFESIIRTMLLNEGYATGGGVHQIRRTLGKKILGKETTPRS